MDKIQRFLVTAGRKDLAQEYYEKTSTYDDLTKEEKIIVDENDNAGELLEEERDIIGNVDFLNKIIKNIPKFYIYGDPDIGLMYVKNPKDRKALRFLSADLTDNGCKWVYIESDELQDSFLSSHFGGEADVNSINSVREGLEYQYGEIFKEMSDSLLEQKALEAATKNMRFNNMEMFLNFVKNIENTKK